jgi:hypothetical protein
VSPASIRKKLGLSRVDWARALNVNERTVMRWEANGDEPGGLAAGVMRGIEDALEEGAEPARVGRLLSVGVGSLVRRALTARPSKVST